MPISGYRDDGFCGCFLRVAFAADRDAICGCVLAAAVALTGHFACAGETFAWLESRAPVSLRRQLIPVLGAERQHIPATAPIIDAGSILDAKKPGGRPGFSDDWRFRSAHFAAIFAI
jgi:hypothetical protein